MAVKQYRAWNPTTKEYVYWFAGEDIPSGILGDTIVIVVDGVEGGGGIGVPETAEVVITPNVKADGGLSLTSEGAANIAEKIGLSFEIPFVQLKQEPWNNTEEKVGLSFEIAYLDLYTTFEAMVDENGKEIKTETGTSIDVLIK